MPGVARLNDSIVTGHGCSATSTVIGGSGNVITNGRPTERKGDSTQIHTIPSGDSCIPHTASINAGSGSVFVNGKSIARISDSVDAGVITGGSGNVNAGG